MGDAEVQVNSPCKIIAKLHETQSTRLTVIAIRVDCVRNRSERPATSWEADEKRFESEQTQANNN